MNLADALALNARFRAKVPALVHNDRAMSYGALDAAVSAAAARLQSFGARRGDVVGVCLQDYPVHLICLFAVLRLGAVLLPMDWRWTLAEQSKIAGTFDARFVLVEPGRAAPKSLPLVTVDESWASSRGEDDNIWPSDLDDSPATLGLSSGTTGEPKAVVITHAQYQARLRSYFLECRLRRDDRYFSTLPLSLSAGRVLALAYLAAGATMVLCPPLSSPAEIAEGIARSEATTVCFVPSVSQAMLQLPCQMPPLLPTVRVLMSIGAPLHPEQRAAIRRRLAPNLVDIYATSGASLASAIHPDEQDRHPGSVGRPALDVDVQIVDENDHPLPSDAVGRVRYRGPGLAAGFHKGVPPGDEDLRDGWFYPGDYGSVSADGYIFLHGRRSEIVIRGGINVYTPEIERALAAHPAVIEAAVVGIASAELGEDLAAFVRCHSPVNVRELVQHCRGLLAPYKIPRAFHFVDALPRNSAGKVRKRLLAQAAGLTLPAGTSSSEDSGG